MRTVLIVAYYFPPSGGPGGQRVLKFVKYLPEFGYKPVVLTVREDADFPARDESLFGEISSEVQIYRSLIVEPYHLYRRITGRGSEESIDIATLEKGAHRGFGERMATWVRANCFIPDARIGWLPFGVKRGLEIIRQKQVDVIFSSSPPYTVSLIAMVLHMITGKPWVADFRDPWTGFLSAPQRRFVARKIDHALEGAVYRKADRITVAWRGIAQNLSEKHPEVDGSKAALISNGYDFEPADRPAEKNARFTLTYSGSLYGKRDPTGLVRALVQMMREEPAFEDRFLLRIVGRIGPSIAGMLKDTLPKACVEIVPYVPHREAVAYLFRSDVLLLIVDEAPEAPFIVPGKVFEYLGVRKPILALAPEGDISGILARTKAGVTVSGQDVQGIACVLWNFYHRWERNALDDQGMDLDEIRRYSRRTQTEALAGVFDDILGR